MPNLDPSGLGSTFYGRSLRWAEHWTEERDGLNGLALWTHPSEYENLPIQVERGRVYGGLYIYLAIRSEDWTEQNGSETVVAEDIIRCIFFSFFLVTKDGKSKILKASQSYDWKDAGSREDIFMEAVEWAKEKIRGKPLSPSWKDNLQTQQDTTNEAGLLLNEP